MKNLLIFLMIPLLSLSQVWTQLPDFPASKRDDGIGVVVDNYAYFGTGLQEWNTTIDFRALNLSTLTWDFVPNMPHTTERQYACGFKGVNCFYIFGGTGKVGALNTLFRYDIATKTWTEKSPKPGKGIVAAAVFDFGNKVIISHGKYEDNSPSREVWEYDLTSDTWTAKNSFSAMPVWRSAYATSAGSGYLIGGIDSAAQMRKELWTYHPANDSWTVIDSFPGPGRAYAAMQSFGNLLYVFGGVDSLQPYNKDFRAFDLTTHSWHLLPALPADGRRGGMSCASSNNFYYTCGIGINGRFTETWQTDLPTSLDEIDKSTLRVYPNPFNSYLYLNEARDLILKAEVYSICGVKMVDRHIQENKLELPELPAGVYMLMVHTKSGRVLTQKIIRE